MLEISLKFLCKNIIANDLLLQLVLMFFAAVKAYLSLSFCRPTPLDVDRDNVNQGLVNMFFKSFAFEMMLSDT